MALETGRWLYRTGMFEQICLVDYSAYQGQEPVRYAINAMSNLFGKSLIDASAATSELCRTSTLIILDNLESLETVPQQELLEVARGWSEAGDSRLLLTTRQASFHHTGYEVRDNRQHIRIQLEGIGSAINPDDALAYFEALQLLSSPPILDEAEQRNFSKAI